MPEKSRKKVVQALAEALLDYLDCMALSAPSAEPAPKLYSYDDLAQMLGKSKSTIRQWVCAGEFGEPVAAGKSTLVTQAGLDKYIADHSQPTQKRQALRQSRVSAAKCNLQDMRL